MYKQTQCDLMQSIVNATRLEANIEAFRKQLEEHKKQLEAAQAKIRYLERRDAYHDGPTCRRQRT